MENSNDMYIADGQGIKPLTRLWVVILRMGQYIQIWEKQKKFIDGE